MELKNLRHRVYSLHYLRQRHRGGLGRHRRARTCYQLVQLMDAPVAPATIKNDQAALLIQNDFTINLEKTENGLRNANLSYWHT